MPKQPNPLAVRDHVASDLYHAVHDGTHGLKVVPGLVKKALEAEVWKERYIGSARQHFPGFASFQAFVEAHPPEGLGASIELLRSLMGCDTRGRDLLDKAMQGKQGGDHRSDKSKLYNVQVAPAGNSQAAALRRLRKSRPDLHKQVVAGELSAHRAAVMAGFRKTLSALEQAKKLAQKLTEDERTALVRFIEGL